MPARIGSDFKNPPSLPHDLWPSSIYAQPGPDSTGLKCHSSKTGTGPDSTSALRKPVSYLTTTSSNFGNAREATKLPDLRRPPPNLAVNKPGCGNIYSYNVDTSHFLRHLGFPPSLNKELLTSLVEIEPVESLTTELQHLDLVTFLNSDTVQGHSQGRYNAEVEDPGYNMTPEMFQMSPCLRPDSSPCADDLGNYAMHVSQMELVWHGEFDRLFVQYYPHAWYLVPTFYPPSDRWRVFKDSAKVRFSCQECGHGWTSMKGRVIFWFHLNYTTNSGYVMFKLYGQQCQKCKNGSYEHAMWYPEEVVKVIGNVYNRVGQIFYGFVRPPLRIDRRQGKPRNQHNAELCQACKEGLCKEEWSFS